MKKIVGFILFFCGLFTLLGLGYWQIERGVWKKDIIAKLDKEYQKDAEKYPLQPEDFLPAQDGRFKVVRGIVNGQFLKNKTLFWPSIYNAQYGYQLMDPFLLENGKILMVNRGWVRRKSGSVLPEKLYLPPYDKKLEIIGVVREIETNYFTLDNEPRTNQWRKFLPKEIEQHLAIENVLPTVLFAEHVKDVKFKALAEVSGTRVYPRNKHHQYAFFWFTLSALWILIFGTFMFKRSY